MHADGGAPREMGTDQGSGSTGWPVWSNDGTRVDAQRGTRDGDGITTHGPPSAVFDVGTRSVIETGPSARPALET